MSVIYLIRHGQASFGRMNYDKLSDVGEAQAKRLGEVLRKRLPQVHVAVTGTMQRHKQTADGCLSAMKAKLKVGEDRGFDEFDHEEIIARLKPRYQNKLILAAELATSLQPKKAFQEVFAQAVERWVSGEYDSEYTESWSMFQARSVSAVSRLGASLASKQHALVFTSGGVITALVQHLLSIPRHEAFKLNWSLVNCGITKVLVGSQGLTLSTLNEHGHFEFDAKRLITYR